jgi:hypothetical protein
MDNAVSARILLVLTAKTLEHAVLGELHVSGCPPQIRSEHRQQPEVDAWVMPMFKVKWIQETIILRLFHGTAGMGLWVPGVFLITPVPLQAPNNSMRCLVNFDRVYQRRSNSEPALCL